MKRLFCYVLLCIVTLLPVSGQTAAMTMPVTMQTQPEHATKADCMMHQQNNASHTTEATTHSCCQDSASDHAACTELSCQSAGCQCDHNSSQINIYLPVVTSNAAGPVISKAITGRQSMAVRGHNTSLFRPPITRII
ncbi:hypothetical protein [Alteromonas gilva]|uniref:Copper-binding protein n=1 Tax=Alteromonas gilva TaxID=2987522 RepID=A0ABT5L6V9_9ALTE|nr:hypothetical protein [Alteromonas gilva]MDC8832618.1 hypothetical protein [Alteromonas gilva]